MMPDCRTFLTARLEELLLGDGMTRPYRSAAPGANIFFDELPRDFLKDNDYAACCLPLQDRSRRSGKLIGQARTLGAAPKYTLTRRRYTREILFRCLLYGPADELWGSGANGGLVDRFLQGVARHRMIADSGNCAMLVDPHDAARPRDAGTELDRKLRRPRLAIVRIQFTGGIQTAADMPIIPSVTIVPLVDQ